MRKQSYDRPTAKAGKGAALRAVLLVALGAAGWGMMSAAWGGPPFLTDDPEPVELHHHELYIFSTATHGISDWGGVAGGVEGNWGAAPNLQLHAIVPLAFDKTPDETAQLGVGDVEIGAKYRLFEQDKGSWLPSVGIFPLLEVPTGEASRGLGSGRLHGFLPIWVEKDWGKWVSYGGGGLWINPGPGNRNHVFLGWMLQRQLTENFALGAEIFHDTPDVEGGRAATGFNIGGIYDVSEHLHLLASAGRGLANAAETNLFSYYLALQWTW